MEPKLIKEGFVVITPTICQGDVMAGHEIGDDDIPMPVVFDTEEEAWKEIADIMVTGLKQFIDGERDFEDTGWTPEDYVALYQEFDNGEFVISDGEGNPIIETTLQEWRENL
jgi:hypothetical protein